jgi:AhpD family alkylhydroperoxidase
MTTSTPFEQARMDIASAAPRLYHGLVTIGNQVQLDPGLRILVNVRASIVNGCAYCIDMHSKDARKAGESEQRLSALPAWRQTPFFDDRERAALALTDAITLISDGHVPREVWDEAERPVRARRAGPARLGDHHDQRLEPHRHQHSDAARLVRATMSAGHPTRDHAAHG